MGRHFCEECGKPLTPGVLFCEECGAKVSSSVPTPPVVTGVDGPAGNNDELIGIIPLVTLEKGLLNSPGVTLVVAGLGIAIATNSCEEKKSLRELTGRIENGIPGSRLSGKVSGMPPEIFWAVAAGIPALHLLPEGDTLPEQETDVSDMMQVVESITGSPPWTRFVDLPPDAILSEHPENRFLKPEDVLYARGERDPDTRSDLLIIVTRTGTERFSCEYGLLIPARHVLFRFLERNMQVSSGLPEEVLGVLVNAEEPQVEGFGFQYYFDLIITNQRVIFTCENEAMADETTEYLKSMEKAAKKRGEKWNVPPGIGDVAGSPYDRYRSLPLPEILLNGMDVNFFIPWTSVSGVGLQQSGKSTDVISFALGTGDITLKIPSGSAAYAVSLLENVIGEKLSYK